MAYSLALRTNGDDSIQKVIALLSLASLEDKYNGWGLQGNLFHILLDRGYSRLDAMNDSRFLFLRVKLGLISTPETRGQYDYVDARQIVPV